MSKEPDQTGWKVILQIDWGTLRLTSITQSLLGIMSDDSMSS